MKIIGDKTTLKYLISLLGLFLISFTVLILTHIYFFNLVVNLDKKTYNLESKIKISRYISEDIEKIRSNFFEMSSGASNEIGIELIYKKIQKHIKFINESLNILDVGGVLNRDIALNIVKESNVKERIVYIPGSLQDYISVKELGIEDKLSGFLEIVNDLVLTLNVKNIYLEEHNIELVNVTNEIIQINKEIPSFFNRINEDVTRIILNTDLKLREARLEIESKKKYYNYLELALIILTLLASLAFALKIAKQIFAMYKAINLESNKLQAILDSTDNMVIVTDGKKINLGNQSFLDFFAVDNIKIFTQTHSCVCEMFLKHEDYFSLSVLEDNDNWIEYMQNHRDAEKIVTMMDSDFEAKSFFVSIKEHKDETYKYVISFADITDIKTESKKYEKMATFDFLTKVYNRQKFNDVFNYELKRNNRYGGNLSLIILDIDFFKKVNDTYGHNVGDTVLINFARVIIENIRSQDTFARWGGEEFVILLPKTDMHNAMKLAEKLREIVENNVESGIPKITASFGVIPISINDSQKSAFIRVDEALYKAKNSGRNCVACIELNESVV